MKYSILFIVFLNMGVSDMGMGRKQNILKREDTRVMNKIHKKYDIDKGTFMKVSSNCKTLRIYSAMSGDWNATDPPGPPDTYFVTPKNKVFTSITEALADIKYVPENEKDAIDIAVMIARFDAPESVHTISKESDIADADEHCSGKLIPKDVFIKYNVSIPRIAKKDGGYEIAVYSYISKKSAYSEFGARRIYKNIIIIDSFNYKSTEEILWEVIDK